MLKKGLIQERKRFLEERNNYEKSKPKGTYTREDMLKQINPDVGNLVSLIASLAPNGCYLELGTSAGYSSLWILEGMSDNNYPLYSHEILDMKIKMARETFQECEIGEKVVLVEGDCRDHLENYSDIAFCFLDCDNHLYREILEMVYPKLVPGGVIVSDNIFSRGGNLVEFLDYVRNSPVFQYYELNVGKGLSVCQKRK